MENISDKAFRANAAAVVSLVRLSCHRSLRAQRQDIGWAADPPASAIEDMGVHHRRTDIPVSQQFLNRPDVIAALE